MRADGHLSSPTAEHRLVSHPPFYTGVGGDSAHTGLTQDARHKYFLNPLRSQL